MKNPRMNTGAVDPRGRPRTVEGIGLAILGLVFVGAWGVGWVIFLSGL